MKHVYLNWEKALLCKHVYIIWLFDQKNWLGLVTLIPSFFKKKKKKKLWFLPAAILPLCEFKWKFKRYAYKRQRKETIYIVVMK